MISEEERNVFCGFVFFFLWTYCGKGGKEEIRCRGKIVATRRGEDYDPQTFRSSEMRAPVVSVVLVTVAALLIVFAQGEPISGLSQASTPDRMTSSISSFRYARFSMRSLVKESK